MNHNPHHLFHRFALAAFLVALLAALCWPAINRHIGQSFILRAPQYGSVKAQIATEWRCQKCGASSGVLSDVRHAEPCVDPSSLHKDADTVRIYAATDDGFEHVTHELERKAERRRGERH